MEVLGYEWFIYKLKGYNENKSNFIPILVVDVNATSNYNFNRDETIISVKSPKKIPTYYGRLYEYNSIGNLEIINNKYNNDYDDYFTIICSVSSNNSVYSGLDIHHKGNPSRVLNNMHSNRTSNLEKTFSLTFVPVFFHTTDDYYACSIAIVENDIYSAPNHDRKGAVPGGNIYIETPPSNGITNSIDAVLREILGVSKRVDPDNP